MFKYGSIHITGHILSLKYLTLHSPMAKYVKVGKKVQMQKLFHPYTTSYSDIQQETPMNCLFNWYGKLQYSRHLCVSMCIHIYNGSMSCQSYLETPLNTS